MNPGNLSDVALVFGTNDPNISQEDFKEKLESNFHVNTDDHTEYADDIIGSIDRVCHLIGAFSCRRIGCDEYDRKLYNDCDSDEENTNNANSDDTDNKIFRSLIEGADHEVSYVHNAVTHAGKNLWRHKCLNMYYLVTRGIIPSPTHPEYTAIYGNSDSSYHDFPRFFKVTRSNGTIQDARWEYNDAMKLHKSKTLNDEYERLYITANYMADPEADIHDNFTYDCYHKNVPLDSVVELTEGITEINFRIFIWSDNKIASSEKSVAEVMTHYNTLHHEWRDERLIPAIKRMSSSLTFNIIYENNPKFNVSITTGAIPG